MVSIYGVMVEKWLLLPDIMQYVNICILLTSLFVLFSQFR